MTWGQLVIVLTMVQSFFSKCCYILLPHCLTWTLLCHFYSFSHFMLCQVQPSRNLALNWKIFKLSPFKHIFSVQREHKRELSIMKCHLPGISLSQYPHHHPPCCLFSCLVFIQKLWQWTLSSIEVNLFSLWNLHNTFNLKLLKRTLILLL